MKIKNVGLMAATIAIIGCGSLSLIISMKQIKGAVQNDASEDIAISANTESSQVNIGNDQAHDMVFDNSKDSAIQLYDVTKSEDLVDMNTITRVDSVYDGRVVTIYDGLVTKDKAIENITKIMDYIYSYVDENIFTPYGIDKSAYKFEIQRQYGRMYEDEEVNYGVFMMKDDLIQCTIGITLGEEPILHAFSMDGLAELYNGVDNEIPKEYLRENWCATTEQRMAIYEEYLAESKSVVENILGLPAIKEGIVDVDSGSYFGASEMWSTVTFGYVLDDGSYINMFYNRVNGKWVGFLIAGYHQDYHDITIE